MGSQESTGTRDKEPAITQLNRALVRLLIRLKLVPDQKAETSVVLNEQRPIAYFAGLGFYKEEDAIAAVAAELGIPVLEQSEEMRQSVQETLQAPELRRLDAAVWRTICAMPVSIKSGILAVAMANPLDVEAVRKLQFDLQLKINVLIAAEKTIFNWLILKPDVTDGLDFRNLLQSSSAPELVGEPATSQLFESNITKEDISEPTVIRLVNKIFAGAIKRQASDVHISPEQGRLVVRLRIDGIMRNFTDIPEAYKEAVIARIKVLCGMDISIKKAPQDGRLRLKTSLGSRDLRISTVPTIHGENLVARILASEVAALTYETLGIPASIIPRLERAVRSTSKVGLICGPTGSGKTSTLYAVLLTLRDGTSNIVTIEDPIEYRLQGINQIQVNQKSGVSFAGALRSVLRQDPDIIMLGEIRDSETATISLQAAQTGHFVLSTIHTNTAAAAITRLRDLAVPSYMIAASLGSVLAQRLVRRLCTFCSVSAGAEITERLEEMGARTDNLREPGSGCEHCNNTGYRGRIGVYSFIEVNKQVAAAIRDEKSEWEIEEIASASGFQTLEQSALSLVEQGITSLAEAERVMGVLDAASCAARSPKETIIHDQPLSLSSSDENIIHKRKILVVDDDENIREIYKMILEYEMYEVAQAENGVDALNQIYQSPPEVILLDLMMPKMGGLETLEKLKCNPKTKNIPVLVLTAASNEENELELMKRGADDFISKTSKSEIIVARINRLINHH